MNEILVVEDSPVNRELLREVLQSRGFSVVEAQDGQEALHLLRRRLPALALIDIQMPKISGFELIRIIRNDPQLAPTKCMALTAYAMAGDQEKVMAAGFDGYVTKPFETQHLIKAIGSLLDGQ